MEMGKCIQRPVCVGEEGLSVCLLQNWEPWPGCPVHSGSKGLMAVASIQYKSKTTRFFIGASNLRKISHKKGLKPRTCLPALNDRTLKRLLC